MEEGNLWGELMDVLKDISNYLAKAGDAEQDKADLDNPPKIKEKQKEMAGGADPAGKPGDVGFAKEFAEIPDNTSGNPQKDINSEGKTQLKKAEDKDDEKEEESSEGKKEDSDDVEDLKSLLKDIKSALMTKSEDTRDVSKLIGDEVKTQLPNAMEKMLRKMGYSISRPDITKIGLEDGVLKKSSDDSSKIEKMSEEKQAEDARKVVDDLSRKSWSELARLRGEATSDFRGFPR